MVKLAYDEFAEFCGGKHSGSRLGHSVGRLVLGPFTPDPAAESDCSAPASGGICIGINRIKLGCMAITGADFPGGLNLIWPCSEPSDITGLKISNHLEVRPSFGV